MEKSGSMLSLKEVPETTNKDYKKLLIRKNSVFKKGLISKRTVRNSLDVTGLIKKKFIPKKNITSPVDLCLHALDYLPKQRDNECLSHIISYLKTLPNFMNVILKEKNAKLSENLIEQISIHLRHEFIPKNNLVCRYGEKGEKFYIILKGKVIFLVPRPFKCYLNLEEYIIYLMQLRKNNEFELLNNLLVENRIFYHIEDDNFDLYLLKEYEEYQKYLIKTGRNYNRSKTKIFPNRLINNRLKSMNNEIGKMGKIPTIRNINLTENNIDENDKNKTAQKYFSKNTYKLMEELIEIIKNPKLFFYEDPFLGLYSPKYYIKSNSVINTKLESKGRKLVTVYTYEEMSTFENGQTFGFIALQSKNSKRIATAIVTEDSNLGVLTKEEYLQFFEFLSNKEKKNLYDLLKFHNLITTISEYKFIKRYYHMFEYIKYFKNSTIMDINKEITDLIVFKSGIFVVNIEANIPELNELITKMRIIRGKLLGLSKYKIEKQLKEKSENQDMIMRKNYISAEENKILSKRHNYTLSIISDHLIIGYPDTVDPVTNLPLFNCTCISAECDGYLISNKSIVLINEESVVIHDLKDFCLMKIEYNINRLQQFKKAILSKLKKNEISKPRDGEKLSGGININYKNNEGRTFSENNLSKKNNKLNINLEEDNYFIERNQTKKKKGKNNTKMLLAFAFNTNFIKTLNNYNTKNEDVKNNKEKDKKKLMNSQININLKTRNNFNNNIKNNTSDINESKTYVIQKLRESILEKQKKIELKKEHYYKIIEDINKNKKEKMKKKIDNTLSINANSIRDIDNISLFTKNLETLSNMNDPISNRIQNSLSQNHFSPKKNLYNSQNNNLYTDKNLYVNSISYKNFNPFLTNINDNRENPLSLPFIDDNKKERNKFSFNHMPNFRTEFEPRKNSIENNKNGNIQKPNSYISYDNLYKFTSSPSSLVKDKFIVFKSPHSSIREPLKIEYDLKSRAKRAGKLKKEHIKKYELNDIENNNADKKMDYMNINLFNNKIKQKTMIEEKYKELNSLVSTLQKTTNEILGKKEDTL